MPYVIKLYVMNAGNGLKKSLLSIMKNYHIPHGYQVVIKNITKEPLLQKDEKIYPLSRWQRALPQPAAQLVKEFQQRQEIVGMDFQFKLEY